MGLERARQTAFIPSSKAGLLEVLTGRNYCGTDRSLAAVTEKSYLKANKRLVKVAKESGPWVEWPWLARKVPPIPHMLVSHFTLSRVSQVV